jgi:uncharacterized oxidoreductase
MAKAAVSGIAAVAVRHANHVGRLGDYTERAAQRGFAALLTVGMAGTGAGLAAPFGGVSRFLGTNPWSIGLPVAVGEPFVMDFATTTVAEGKVRVAMASGKQVPEGTVMDTDGMPTRDPARLYEQGTLTLLGGATAGHKGYGLSMAAALLGALAMIGDGSPTAAGTMAGPPPNPDFAAGVFLLVIDPEWFGGREAYAALCAAITEQAHAIEPAPGFDGVLVPGEPEVKRRAERARDGIAIPEATWHELEALGRRYGVALPSSD